MQMTVAELFDLLLEGLESGRLQGDEPASPELFEGRHENLTEYLARKYNIGSDADGQKSNLRLHGCEGSGKRD